MCKRAIMLRNPALILVAILMISSTGYAVRTTGLSANSSNAAIASSNPPSISVSPTALNAALYTGETTIQSLTIANVGGSDLTFLLFIQRAEVSSLPAATALEGIFFTDERISDGVPVLTLSETAKAQFTANLAQYYQNVTGVAAAAHLLSVAVVGNYNAEMLYYLLQDTTLTNRYIFYPVDDYSTVTLLDGYEGLVIAASDHSISEPEAATVADFFNSGRPVLMGMDDLDDVPNAVQNYLFPTFGISTVYDGAYYEGTINPSNPITEGISEVYSFSDSDNDWYELDDADWIFAGADGHYYGVSFDERSRSVLMGENLVLIRERGNQPIISNAIKWMLPTVVWLSLSTDAGTVAPGEDMQIDASFDAVGLAGGEYGATIRITSNDEVSPELEVAVGLTVTDAPDITVVPDAIDFGSVFIDRTASGTLTIANDGTLPLSVTNITSDHADFSIDATTFILQRNERTEIEVTFTPTTAGQVGGELTITSDDPDHPITVVALSGEGTLPPQIAVSPSSFSETLLTGGVSTRYLTIDNTAGGSDLEFTIHIESQTATSARLQMYTRVPPAPPTTIPADAVYAPNRVIVKLRDTVHLRESAEFRTLFNAKIMREYPTIGAEVWQISGISVADAVAQYADDPRVEYIEPDYRCQILRVPNDTRYAELWGMHNEGQLGGTPDADIDAPEAWDICTGGRVIVGVIDTGVDDDHEDLADNMWVNPGEVPDNGVDDDGNGYVDDIHGWDFVNNDNDPHDDHGHGTHCSGTIAGKGNNSLGVAGVCWSAKIMALKFLDAGGYGWTSDAVAAVEYAIANGVDLTSNSWGGGAYSSALYDAIAAAGAANQLFIAAAGNDGVNNDSYPHYPSSYNLDNIIAVAATGGDDAMAGFSCYGPTSVDLGAPGVGILSAQPGNYYDYKSGTSMAAPHVSGACALVWSFGTFLSNYEVRDAILEYTNPLVALAGKTVTGGRLNVCQSLQNAKTWLLPEINAGVVPAGTTLQIGLTFNATRLAGGDYEGNIVIESNDPVEPLVVVPATLSVTAAPDIYVEPDTLIFGDVYHDYPKTLSVTIANIGADILSVTEINSSAGEFTVDLNEFQLEPFTETVMQVTFAPVMPGVIHESLSIASNDPDSPLKTVELFAVARDCPIMGFSPDTLQDSLLTGELGADTMYIHNTGPDVLEYSFPCFAALALQADSTIEHNVTGHDFGFLDVAVGDQDPRVGNPVVLGAGGPDSSRYYWIDSDEPGGPVYDYVDISATGTPVAGLGNFNYIGPLPIGFDFHFYDRTYREFYIQSNGVINFDDTYITSANQPLPLADGYNNLLAWLWDYLGGDAGEVYYQNFDNMLVIQFKEYGITNGGSVNAEVVLYADGRIKYQYEGFYDGFGGERSTVGIENADGTDGLEVAFNTNYLHDEMAILFSRVPEWISGVNPASGAVTAGDSLAVGVSFSALDMFGGDYSGVLWLQSNDCEQPDTVVAARLHVTGIQDILVTPEALDYGPLFIGLSLTKQLSIVNSGTDVLTVDNIVSDHPDFTVDTTQSTLNPLDIWTILVTFTPSSIATIAGTLTITSDDPDESVVQIPLSGIGLDPPVISIAPGELSQVLFTGCTATQTMTITNSGGNDLEFEAAVTYAQSLQALASRCVAGILLSGEQEIDGELAATFNETEWQQYQENLAAYYQGVDQLAASAAIPKIAMVGAYRYNMQYYLLSDTMLSNRYAFYSEDSFSSPELLDDYDGLVVAETDYGLRVDEASTVAEFYQTGRPIIMGMDDLDDQATNIRDLLCPVFGIAGVADGDFSWGSLNPDNPITDGITQVRYFGSDNDAYIPDGCDWIFAGADGRYYGVSHSGLTHTVLMGEGLSDIWGYGNDALVRNAINWMMTGETWLSVSPDAGIVAPGASREITLIFDAFHLPGGNYSANLDVAHNDPSQPEVSVPVQLTVTDAADIHVDADSLDFGDVYLTYPVTMPLTIFNHGTLPLEITSLSADNEEFTIDISELLLPPDADSTVHITFDPTTSRTVTATLSIVSNDPCPGVHPVHLSAVARDCPELSFYPDTARAELSIGESGADTIVLKNVGLDLLEFTMPAFAAMALVNDPTLEQNNTKHDYGFLEVQPGETDPRIGNPVVLGAGGPDNSGYYWIDSDEPGGPAYNFVDISTTGTPVTGLGGQRYVGPLPIGFDFPFYDRKYTEFFIQSNGVINFDNKYITPGNQPLPQADGYNNLLAWFWDYLDGAAGHVYYQQFRDMLVVQFLDYGGPYGGRVDAQVILYANGNILYQYKGFYLGFTVDRSTVGIENADGTDGLVVAFNTKYLHSELAIMFGRAPEWLTGVKPSSGAIASNDSLLLEVDFTTQNIIGGTYLDSLVILSNDCTVHDTLLYAHMRAIGIPDLAVVPGTVEFRGVFQGLAVPETLVVINRGTDLLSVSDIVSTHPDYTVDTTSFTVRAGMTQQVIVTFRPGSTGSIPATLTITSNDPDEPSLLVPLAGEGLVAPDITVTPAELSDTLPNGCTSTQLVTVANDGGNDLEFLLQSMAVDGLGELAADCVDGITPTGVLEINGEEFTTFTAAEAAEYAARLEAYYQGTAALAETEPLQHIAVVGGSSYDMHYYLLTQSALNSRYVFHYEYYYYDYAALQGYDGLIISEYDASISDQEAYTIREFYRAGKPVLMGMNGLDEVSTAAREYLYTTFGIAEAADGEFQWGNVNPANPIAIGIDEVKDWTWTGNDNWYVPAGGNWLFAGTDGNYYGVSYNGVAKTVLIGGNLLNVWYAGNIDLVSQAVIWMMAGPSWLTIAPEGGIIPPAGQVELEVTFDASGLSGGPHWAQTTILNNDPDEAETIVQFTLQVTDAPDISVDRDTLEFGDVYINYPEQVPLVITNVGTDSLFIAAFHASITEFSTDISVLRLGPGKAAEVYVSWAPTGTGIVSATLTIISNDPNEATLEVRLSGNARECPDISFTPDTLINDMLVDEFLTDTLILKNVGSDIIEYTFPAFAAVALLADPALEHNNTEYNFGLMEIEAGQPDPRVGNPVVLGAGGPDSSGYRWIDSDEPGGPYYNYIDISQTGTPITGLGNHKYVGPLPIGFEFPFYDRKYTEFYIQSNGVINLDNEYITSSNQPLPQADGYDNLLAWFWDYLGGEAGKVYYQQLAHMLVIQFVKYGTAYGTVDAEVILYANGNIMYQYKGMYGVFSPLRCTVGIENDDGTDGLGVVFNSAYIHDELAVLFSRIPPRLVGVYPASGRIFAGDSLPVEIKLSTYGHVGGNYLDSLLLSSNDCDNHDTLLYVRLHITGIPHIAVNPLVIDYEPLFVGLTVTDTFYVLNTGTDLLTVADIVSDHADYTIDTPTFSLVPGESRPVRVAFAPSTVGRTSATLTVHSDDPDTPQIIVNVSGEGLEPPDISIFPTFLADSLFTGCSSAHTITVANDGGNDLEFSLFNESVPELRAAAEACVAGVTQTAMVDIDGRMLPAFSDAELRQYETNLEFYYQAAANPVEHAGLPRIAVVGDYASSLHANLLNNPDLNGRYVFYLVHDFSSVELIKYYDALVIAERDRGISENEAMAIVDFYELGNPIVMGLDDLDDDYGMIGDYLFPIFGVSGSADGMYAWGSLNHNHPISRTVGEVKPWANDYDWYTPAGCDWILAGSDGHYYAVAYDGKVRTVLFGGNLWFVYFDGNSQLVANAISWSVPFVPWLTIAPESGSISPGSSLELAAVVDAERMNGGEYYAHTIITTNDPDESEVVFPLQLTVTAAPDLRLDADSLLFGDVYLGYARSLPLAIHNIGSLPLTIADMPIDQPEFAVDYPSLVLNPDEDTSVQVTFNPTATGLIGGTLSMLGDDPCPPPNPVYLVGNARECPDIAFYPDTLLDSMQVDAIGGDSFVLKNIGPDVLEYSIPSIGAKDLLDDPAIKHNNTVHDFGFLELEPGEPDPRAGNPVILGAGGPDNSGYRWIDSDQTNGPAFDYLDISKTGTPITGLGYYNRVGPLPIGFDFPFYDSVYTEFYVQSNGVINFVDEYITPSNQPLPQADGYDNLLAWFWDYLDGRAGEVFYQQFGNMLVIQFQHYGEPNVGSVDAEVILNSYGNILFQYRSFNGYFQVTACTVGIENADGSDGLEVAFNTDYLHGDLAILFSRLPRWISNVIPASGAIAAGDSLTIDVEYSSAGMIGGMYWGDLPLFSNDCDHPDTVLIAGMHLTGIPDIAANPPEIDFGPRFIGLTVTDTLLVINDGTDVLTVTDVASAYADFRVDTTHFTVDALQAQPVVVSFAPSTDRPITGTLTITSDDPDEPALHIPVSGAGLLPPDITVTPPTCTDTLYYDETSTQELSIANDGFNDLTFTIYIRPESHLRNLAAECLDGVTRTGEIDADGKRYATFTDTERALFASHMEKYSQQTINVTDVPRIAVAGSTSYEMLYYLLSDTSLGNNYVFDNVNDDYNVPVLKDYDGVIIAEYDYSITETEAAAIYDMYQSGRPILMGMDDLDDEPLSVQGMIYPVFGISGVADGTFHWGIANPSHPITQDIDYVYEVDGDNDWYIPDGCDWLFAGTDGHDYGVAFLGVAPTVLIGENLFYMWAADNSRLVANAIHWMMSGSGWLGAAPRKGTLPPGTSENIELTYDAARLSGGDHYAELLVLSNDPDEPQTAVSVHLHVINAPDIVIDVDSLHFGDVYVGYPVTLPLPIANHGTADLVISDIAADLPEFSVDYPSLTLKPAKDTVIQVTCAPLAAGISAGHLSIASDDRDTPLISIAVDAIARECPAMTFYPDTLFDSLESGQTGGDTLILKNVGLDVLEFVLPSYTALSVLADSTREHNNTEHDFGFIELEEGQTDPRIGNPVVLGAGGPDSTGYRWIDSDEPGGPSFNFIDISSTGIPVTGLTSNNYVGPFPLGFTFPFYDSAYTEFYIQANGLINFDDRYIISINQRLPLDDGYDNLLAWFWRRLDGTNSCIYYQQLGDMLVIQFDDLREYYGAGTFDVNVVIYATGSILFQYGDFQNGFEPVQGTVGIENAHGTDGLEVACNTDYLHEDLAIFFSRVPQWITGVCPTYGEIPTNDSVTIAVDYSSVDILGGTYLDSLAIHTNDCGRHDTLVYARLRVAGIPDLVVFPDTLNYGEVYLGLKTQDTIDLFNDGTDGLSQITLASDHPDFSCKPTQCMLRPGEHQALWVTYAPSTVAAHTGTITISSDDPDDPRKTVVVEGTGLLPAGIVLKPTAVNLLLLCDQSTARTMTISNNGGEDLVFGIVLRDENPDGMTVEEALSSVIERSGILTGDIHLNTVDLDSGEDVELVYTSPEDIARVAYSTNTVGPPVAIISATSRLRRFDDVQDKLLGTGKFSSVSIIDAGVVSPTYAELAAFAAVLVWSDMTYSDNVALGNALADYVDNGGGVVCAVYEVAASMTSPGYHLGGRWETEKYYILERDRHIRDSRALLGEVFEPDHPIMAGVDAFDGGSRSHRPVTTALTGGASLIANWSDGKPLVATKKINGIRRVDLGFFPPSATVDGSGQWDPQTDGDLLLANSLLWSGLEVKWMRPSPLGGLCPVNDTLEIALEFSAAGLAADNYQASLWIHSNDYRKPELQVPIRLAVRDPGVVCQASIQWPVIHVSNTVEETNLNRTNPLVPEPDDVVVGMFSIRLLFCDQNKIMVGDSANVFVDINRDGVFADTEYYPAAVSAAGTAPPDRSVTVGVYMGNDLGSGHYPVAVQSIGDLALKFENGEPIELGRETVGQQLETPAEIVRKYTLGRNYPNPFNAGTVIHYSLTETGPVTLKVYDILGRDVCTLVDEVSAAGRYESRWDGCDNHRRPVPSGVYFYQLKTGNWTASRKMVLLK